MLTSGRRVIHTDRCEEDHNGRFPHTEARESPANMERTTSGLIQISYKMLVNAAVQTNVRLAPSNQEVVFFSIVMCYKRF